MTFFRALMEGAGFHAIREPARLGRRPRDQRSSPVSAPDCEIRRNLTAFANNTRPEKGLLVLTAMVPGNSVEWDSCERFSYFW